MKRIIYNCDLCGNEINEEKAIKNSFLIVVDNIIAKTNKLKKVSNENGRNVHICDSCIKTISYSEQELIKKQNENNQLLSQSKEWGSEWI